MSSDLVQNQSIAIAIVLLAGSGLLISSLLFLRRYNRRQRELAAGLARHQQLYFGPSALEAGRLPHVGTAQAPVSRQPEPVDATGEELPTYGVASKSPAVEVVTYPPMVYAPPGNAEPPPYEMEGEPSASRVMS
ncbi:hypothetical protein CALVIDRAFT_134679 [Calocera viscosa TUFC12733]|uniref:Uncharacterized protein n=1 Tax=Calocera viscosa (strain TUFC12733) TaxID=1330018 RepID=A0A167LXU2_CALVF|nr:hypothetical protein CALVIDRAFT_134679 [Calocera viscosa TUFC12733]